MSLFFHILLSTFVTNIFQLLVNKLTKTCEIEKKQIFFQLSNKCWNEVINYNWLEISY